MDTNEAAEELRAVVENWNWNADADSDEQVRWHPNYSGRFMYGATCIGISGYSFTLADVWADLPKEYREQLGKATRDSLGMGEIWYWPGVRVGGA